jgi:hypothetical protein
MTIDDIPLYGGNDYCALTVGEVRKQLKQLSPHKPQPLVGSSNNGELTAIWTSIILGTSETSFKDSICEQLKNTLGSGIEVVQHPNYEDVLRTTLYTALNSCRGLVPLEVDVTCRYFRS